MEELFHFKKTLPLFCAKYDVLISDDSKELIAGASMLYDDISIVFTKNWSDTTCSFSCTIAHSERGNLNILFFNVGDVKTSTDFLPTIIKECSNVSWNILEGLGIELYSENKNIQAYVLKDLVTEVKESVEEYLDSKYGPDAL